MMTKTKSKKKNPKFRTTHMMKGPKPGSYRYGGSCTISWADTDKYLNPEPPEVPELTKEIIIQWIKQKISR